MKFFLDTANVKEIREAHDLGVLDGVTTNPSLIAKEGRDYHEVIAEICKIVKGPISAEVVATDRDGMVKEGRVFAKIAENVVVKCPIIPEGIKATKILSGEGVKVNATLCFSATQALIAAKAGASFVSPFLGRVDDVSSHGMQIIHDIRAIYDNYDFKTEILAASLRHPMHVLESALAGADAATMPHKVLLQCFKHPLTDVGLKKFLEDWEKARKK
ncbi:MAG: fructose-6-phosphate aldolase [Acidobacteriota bacterium]|nr:MAG: fructose-6-phosphate aldolase [Acidobacteriota bacterium]